MDPLIIAIIVAVFTLIVLFSGIPIAFGLSFVSIALLVAFEGFQMLDVFAETFYAGLNSFVLLSIPMFILMGMAVANSPAGKDLYTGLDRWLWRVPGGPILEITSPPGTLQSHLSNPVYKSLPAGELATAIPIKINIGIESKTNEFKPAKNVSAKTSSI